MELKTFGTTPRCKLGTQSLFRHQGSHGVDLEARIRQLPAACSIGAVDPTKSISLYYAKAMQDLEPQQHFIQGST